MYLRLLIFLAVSQKSIFAGYLNKLDSCDVRKICSNGLKEVSKITNIGGSQLNWPQYPIAYGNTLIVSDASNIRVVVLNEDGSSANIYKTGLNYAEGTSVYKGRIYVPKSQHPWNIKVYSFDGHLLSTINLDIQPKSVTVYKDKLYINTYLKFIQEYSLSGTKISTYIELANKLGAIHDIVWGNDGNAVLTQLRGITKFSKDKTIIGKTTKEYQFISQSAIDSFDNILFGTKYPNRLEIFDSRMNFKCSHKLPHDLWGLTILKNCSIAMAEVGQDSSIHIYEIGNEVTTNPASTAITPTEEIPTSTVFDGTTTQEPIHTTSDTSTKSSSSTESPNKGTTTQEPVHTTSDISTKSSSSTESPNKGTTTQESIHTTSDTSTKSSSSTESPNKGSRGCKEGWFNYKENCYRLFDEKTGWFDAELTCQEFNGHVASITGVEDDDFLQALSLCREEYWIGMVLRTSANWKANSAWCWWDGQNHTYSKLNLDLKSPSAAKENCVYHRQNTIWNTDNCRNERNYICKTQKVIESNHGVNPIQSKCPSDWHEYNDYCYFLSHNETNYFHAQLACQEMEASVVTILSKEEQTFVQILQSCKTKVWIGLERSKPCLSTNSSMCWEWMDLTNVTYSKWFQAKPDEDLSKECVINDGGWMTEQCTQKRKFICKKKLL